MISPLRMPASPLRGTPATLGPQRSLRERARVEFARHVTSLPGRYPAALLAGEHRTEALDVCRPTRLAFR